MVENKVYVTRHLNLFCRVEKQHSTLFQNCQDLQKIFKNLSSENYGKLTLPGQGYFENRTAGTASKHELTPTVIF